ncbi:hypothetical protein [Shewanella algae]|uniref:hypothetical protein n=1 Tax=Shewanella algae TaxID=38313 RepID=UPI001AAD49F0|nr:hypothetical protein [Shewanella algae]MBO2558979.1 hypothetical protein [Shewanella algae]MBO2575867.1 hypothetical protein [Shewanella algae]
MAAGPGVSAAVFLGEIYGAGNGQHLVSASMANSMAKSGSWPGCFSCSVPGRALRRRQWSAPGAGLDGQEWRLGPGVSAAVFLGEIYGAGNGQHLVSASMANSMAKSGSWARGVSAAVFLGELCGAGNGQHLAPASMAKSGGWARGVSVAVFLGEIYGAGNGQHLVPASMAKSGSWARDISAAVKSFH